MDDNRRFRAQELERLRVELAKAGRLLDELERRSKARERNTNFVAAPSVSFNEVDSSAPETRFAACVSRGLARLNSK